jgi:hypothetical protein
MRIFHSRYLQAGEPQKAGQKNECRRIEFWRKKQAAAPESSQGLLTDRKFAQAWNGSEPGMRTGPPIPACLRRADAAEH